MGIFPGSEKGGSPEDPKGFGSKTAQDFYMAHRNSDVDFDRTSQHHTLGDGPLQAASGATVRQLQQLVDSLLYQTGDVKVTFAEADNVNWFELGSEISRTGAGAALFALFGTTYGAGNGSTTFDLPDPSDKVLRLLGAASSEDPGDIGGVGDNEVALIEANLAGHVHTMAHTHTGPSHTHGSGTLTVQGRNGGPGAQVNVHAQAAGVAAIVDAQVNGSTAAGGTGNTGASSAANTGTTGTGTPFDVTNDYFGLRALIHA